MSPKKNTVEHEHKKIVVFHYLEEIILLATTVLAILAADLVQKAMRGEKILNDDLNLQLANIITSSVLALIVYGKRYSNFKEIGRTKPSFLLRMSDAIIYGIGFKGIVGIGIDGGK
jgi:hypothetical protein